METECSTSRAKKSGRERWYASYDIEIAEIIDKKFFDRKTSKSSA